MDNRIDIASATGVDLHLNIAGPGARSYAFVIDWHIRLLLALAWLALVALLLFGEIGFFNAEDFEFDVVSKDPDSVLGDGKDAADREGQAQGIVPGQHRDRSGLLIRSAQVRLLPRALRRCHVRIR